MGRAAHGVFIDSSSGSEEARDKIKLGIVRDARNDDASHRNLPQLGEVRLQRANKLLRFDKDELIELRLPNESGLNSEGVQ